jgi:hypothetical protein
MGFMKSISLCLLLLSASSCMTRGQEFNTDVLSAHIKTLAADSMKGRGTGTEAEVSTAVYIQSEFKKLKLKPFGDDKSYLQSFPFAKGPHGQGDKGVARNVVAFLDNKGKTTIVIGAHYDHLGIDGQGSSLDANPANKIHNGADDNASGVAGVIELARHFAANRTQENSNFVFVCFSGEELGLLGSKYFVDHSPVDLASVDFMINLDMIGRLNPQTKSLIINGTGTSAVWEPLLKNIETEGVNIVTDSSGTGPSDHTSFYLKNIPVLHFFTGAHEDYHKPSDDFEKINSEGVTKVLRLIVRIIESLDSEPKLAFLPTKSKMQGRPSAFKVTLGIMPSYASDVEGLKVDGVSQGKPAEAAGIKSGDIIIQMGNFPIKDIYNYMDALGKFEKGQSVPIKVKRGNESLDLTVTF